MLVLHPHLLGFLEGLCAASVTRYPEYGMFVRGPDSDIPLPSGEGATRKELCEFFLTALSDTSCERPADAEFVVDRFLGLIAEHHPSARTFMRVSHSKSGWFDGLDIWIDDGSSPTYLNLDWSVS